LSFPIYKKRDSGYNGSMSSPTLTTRNNPELTKKLTDTQKMYRENAGALPGQSKSGDTMSTTEYMDSVDRRTGKSRLFAVQTPGEKIQQAQGPKGILSQQQSLLTGGK
jgi:hypothetical protein